MHQKDPVKVEIWLDGIFFNKIDVDPAGYSVVAVIKEFKAMAEQGLVPSANKIEVRRAL